MTDDAEKIRRMECYLDCTKAAENAVTNILPGDEFLLIVSKNLITNALDLPRVHMYKLAVKGSKFDDFIERLNIEGKSQQATHER